MMAPEFPRRVSVADVVQNARCELYDAVQANIGTYPWIGQWAAGFEFSFVVDRDANASTDTSYLIPVQHGTFTLGLKASLKQKARGTYALGYKILKGLRNYHHAGCSPALDGQGRGRLLSGEIGLRRWISDVVPEIDRSRIANSTKGEPAEYKELRKSTGEISSLSYTIEFGVTADGSLLPSWALSFPDKRQFRPAINLALSEATTHKLIVAMTPLSIDPPAFADKSAILGSRDGKTVIVGRRVCVIDKVDSDQCLDEATEGSAKEASKELSRSLKEQAEKKQEIQNLRQALPPPLRNRSISELERSPSSDDTTRRSVDSNKQTIDRLKDTQVQLEQAQQRASAARKTLEAGASAARQTEARARAEAESDASRRLDQLIQQQVIRDAFRP